MKAASGESPTVTLTFAAATKSRQQTETDGDGPLDALFHAIETITGITAVLARLPRAERDARQRRRQAEAMVELEHNGQFYRGRGTSTDTVEASTCAQLNAINRIASGAGQPIAERPDQL